MRFHQVIESVSWEAVASILVSEYPMEKYSIDNFRHAFLEIRQLNPIHSDEGILIQSELLFPEDDAPVVTVAKKNRKLHKDLPEFDGYRGSAIAETEVTSSLMLEGWEHWLGMRIEHESLDRFSHPEIVAHCLWEMTFCGYSSSDLVKAREEIHQIASELKRPSK